MKIQLYKCITGARVAGLPRVYSANKSRHVILIVSQNSASMCQHAQLYNDAIFRELHAIMFLSLSGVSITFANLYILFHAVFIGCPWAWETLGGRYLNLPALCQSYSPQLHTKSKCKFETLYVSVEWLFLACLHTKRPQQEITFKIHMYVHVFILFYTYFCSAGIHTFTHRSVTWTSAHSWPARRDIR